MSNWSYNEFKHCGVDYSDVQQAEVYDIEHNKFRDFESEVNEFLNELSLENAKEMTLIDLACGTGAIPLYASKYFKNVIAVDVSEAMINRAMKKAHLKNISNIEFVHAGFLSYEHISQPADVISTKYAFHHLPDFWKQIALSRINKMLKTGGVFYLYDVIYQFEPHEYERKINDWIAEFKKTASEQMCAEVATHIREEFSTFGWIIEGMLERAGFKVEKIKTNDEIVAEYFCRKL